MRVGRYTLIGAAVGVVFWLVDAGIHLLVYGEAELELVPEAGNELWMRAATVLLVAVVGVLFDWTSRRQRRRDRAMYRSLAKASQHVLNNLVNQMQLVELVADGCPDLDPEALVLLRGAMTEASEQVEALASLERLEPDEVWKAVAPRRPDPPAPG